jgi:imidazolonepropionase-like amidohydrolase
MWIRQASAVLALAAVARAAPVSPQPAPASRAQPGPVLYEGARLILGDERPSIDRGAFVVADGRIVSVGRQGQVVAPAGGTRVDLSGKTVMPALVNAHAHVGYEKFVEASGESRAESFTVDNLIDHLQRQAYFGVGAVLDGGSASLPIAQQYHTEWEAGKLPSAARLTLMGGVVPVNGGPDHILIQGTRPLKANYEVTLSPEARAAVRDIRSKNVRHVKIWIGDRNGTYPAMPHEVYDAVIEEAHKTGMTVHAHATTVRDQKDALRAGADLLVHTVQGALIDDELIGLVREKKPYWTTVFGLGDRSEVCDKHPFVIGVLPAAVVADILATDCKPNPNASARNDRLRLNFTRMVASGARVVLGTDAGVWPRYSFGSADHHELERYVELGLTPDEAIVAATSRPAEAIGLTDAGVLGVGKRADFLVLEASPLEDIRNTRRISSVYLKGVKLDREAMLDRWQAPASESR